MQPYRLFIKLQLYFFQNPKKCIGILINLTKKNSKLIKASKKTIATIQLVNSKFKKVKELFKNNFSDHQIFSQIQEKDELEFSETWQRRLASSDTKIRNLQNTNRNFPGILIEIVQAFLRNAFEVSTNKFPNLRSCATTCKLNPNCHFICE